MKNKTISQLRRVFVGGMLNNQKTWAVTWKGKVIDTFRTYNAARNFMMQNNKDYFRELKLESVVT